MGSKENISIRAEGTQNTNVFLLSILFTGCNSGSVNLIWNLLLSVELDLMRLVLERHVLILILVLITSCSTFTDCVMFKKSWLRGLL